MSEGSSSSSSSSTAAAAPMFACAACGKKFRWKPEIAGKAGKCACGARLVAPAKAPVVAAAGARVAKKPVAALPVAALPVAKPPGAEKVDEPHVAPLSPRLEEEEGLYDVADDAPAPAAPKALTIGTGGLCPGCGAALPARAVLCVGCGFDLRKGARLATADDEHPAGAGSVARVGAVTAAAAASRVGVPGAAPVVPPAALFPAKKAFQPVLEEERGPVMPNNAWEVVLSAALVALGVYLTFLVAMRYGKDPLPVGAVAGSCGITILANLGLMVAAILVAAYTIEDAFLDPVWKIVLKTCAIGLVPVPVGQILGAQIGDINGDVARVFTSIGLYVGLFLLLFRLNILHTAACVLVIWVIRTGVDYAIFKYEGIKTDAWI